ncbi:MAG TPA: hypothetical protein VFA06_24745 [Actinocrinis sp.]|uniref:hypothetical protein n=1 Tax=Actinocrinis sp. TaxID=1920516 RepID=UPI002D51A3EC|nr:hypothetical protein [Actinocrinis sp.]HZU59112.1 hypothetical protein [Actinocrinis sp.]
MSHPHPHTPSRSLDPAADTGRSAWVPLAPTASPAAALRAGYPDPARVAAVPAGPLFDAVSVGMDLGLEALDLLLRTGAPIGPVAADGRAQVRRVGFLLAPGTLARLRGFSWWCRTHGLRTASHGDVVALPPLIGDGLARLLWLVPPPEGGSGPVTDPALLLGALRRALCRASGGGAGGLSSVSALKYTFG